MERKIVKDLYQEKEASTCPSFQRVDDMDEESLLQEMEEAERLWEEEKAAHPEVAEAMEKNAEEQFKKLMKRIRAEEERMEEIRIQTERCSQTTLEIQMEVQQKQNQQRIWQKWSRGNIKKVAIIGVVIGALLGRGMIYSVAKNGYKFMVYPKDGKENVQIRYNTNIEYNDDKLEATYDWIAEQLDIPVMMTFYMPEEMYFLELEKHETYAVIKFDFKGKRIFLRQSKLLDANTISYVISDRKTYHEVRNDWINKDLKVEENQLENGVIEYSVVINNDVGVYYLTGVMEKEEFDRISENLVYR